MICFSLIYSALLIVTILTLMATCETVCTAVVPYEDGQKGLEPIAQLYHKLRTFHIGQFTIELEQDWVKQGLSAVVWNAAETLAEYLAQLQWDYPNAKILELGAGTGLVSIVACLMGAEVVATDLPAAVEILRKNLQRNVDSQSNCLWSAQPLVWGKELPTDSDGSKFDLIVGSDIIYDESVFEDLLTTLNHFADQKTTVIIAVTYRYSRDHKFIRMLRRIFTVDQKYYDPTRNVYVYHCSKL